MKFGISILALAALTAPAMAQVYSSSLVANEGADGGVVRGPASVRVPSASPRPFSRIAIGGSISPLGPGVQVTGLVNEHLNLRATGSLFNYSTQFTESGFDAHAKLNLASAGVSADIYPFHKGFRVSPGLLFYNQNRLSATSTVTGGASITLNNNTYYSANANPLTGATPLSGGAALGLNSTRPAFTVTTGWGNAIQRSGRHWAFPFEVGVALTGPPSLAVNLNGWACQDAEQTSCANVASTTNPVALHLQSDLNLQVAQWKNNLEPLKTFPIVSFGATYSLGSRGGAH